MNRAGKILSLLIKILVVVGLVGLGIFVYQTCAGTPLIQRIDKVPPDETVAPYQIVTRTRTYYAQRAVANTDNSVTMWGWYEKIDGRWVLHNEEFTLKPVLRPSIGRR